MSYLNEREKEKKKTNELKMRKENLDLFTIARGEFVSHRSDPLIVQEEEKKYYLSLSWAMVYATIVWLLFTSSQASIQAL